MPGRRKEDRPFALKILLGLMMAEERNCRRLAGAAILISMLVLGLWLLPGTDLLWRLAMVLQATARYHAGLLGTGPGGLERIYGVSDESLGGVFDNLRRAWQHATRP